MIIHTKPENTTLSIGDKTIYNLEDLQNYFFLADVVKHFQSSELHKWCKDNYYVEQVKNLYNISANSTHIEVIKKLIFIFAIKNVFTSKTNSIDADEYIKSLEQNIKEQLIIKKYLSDVNNVEKIVYDYLQKPEHKEKIIKQFFVNTGSFSTKISSGGLVGIAGEQGFGVCECPDIDNLQWINAMPGSNDKSSENYGNYETLNGSVMCCIPKFFYRWGNPSSPNYAKYRANALDIVGVDIFRNESEANAAGYALHRAFIDNGKEQPYFFIDKYLCSKDGNNSCKSVKNGDPISLIKDKSYTCSQGMEGCTGIYADAVVLSKARGEVFNCMSIFQQNAIAMLSLAHGQASTSDTYCAWYDAAGMKNYPKGCNYKLTDCDDTSVKFTSAGNSGDANKPQAGSGNPFAKTTHNGQACGVADINGSLYQVMLGITNAGRNATDTTQIKNNNAYVLKRTAKLSTLTGGFGGTTDAWGTESSLANNYDFVVGIFNSYLLGKRVGKETNQVFSSEVSGTDWLKTCAGITTHDGYSGCGTNIFGKDYYCEVNIANMFPLCSFISNYSFPPYSGVWSRNFYHVRSHNNYCYTGFRAAAYRE